MKASDQRKLVRAGFTVIRREVHFDDYRIKVKRNGNFEWHTLEKDFESKAALDRRVNVLLKDNHIVED